MRSPVAAAQVVFHIPMNGAGGWMLDGVFVGSGVLCTVGLPSARRDAIGFSWFLMGDNHLQLKPDCSIIDPLSHACFKKGGKRMSHYVISDLHGEADRFDALLGKIEFSPEDQLYILGDVVDRGPHGISLLLRIMEMPNVTMLLGNHEFMFLQYLSPHATQADILRWNRNGNQPTLEEYADLTVSDRRRIKNFLSTLETHLEVEVGGRRFYLVHGFPGENVHDEVWCRPTPDTPNPVDGTMLILGHTPVMYLGKTTEERAAYIAELERAGDHARILHTPGFIDLDCGCGHGLAVRSLACLRLEDLAEFYV